ncbi:extensin-like [Portunus trituberculatus]|uniref:extensin-like n=1 Tax=Portunus trituberculatus TaxID=210409 RepID=UPI001E1CF4DC|nr:extensin-like [Portunus trituberculatus]
MRCPEGVFVALLACAVLTTRCQSATVPEASQGPLDAPAHAPIPAQTEHDSPTPSTKERTERQVSSDSFQYAAQVASETDTGAELKGLEAAKTETHDASAGSDSDINTRSAKPLSGGEKTHGPHPEAQHTRYFVTRPYNAPSNISPWHFGSGHSHRQRGGTVRATARTGRPAPQTIRPSYKVFSQNINVTPRPSARYNTHPAKLSYPVTRHEKPDYIRFHSDKPYTPLVTKAKLEFADYGNTSRSHWLGNRYGRVRNQQSYPIKSVFSFVLPGTPPVPKDKTSYIIHRQKGLTVTTPRIPVSPSPSSRLTPSPYKVKESPHKVIIYSPSSLKISVPNTPSHKLQAPPPLIYLPKHNPLPLEKAFIPPPPHPHPPKQGYGPPPPPKQGYGPPPPPKQGYGPPHPPKQGYGPPPPPHSGSYIPPPPPPGHSPPPQHNPLISTPHYGPPPPHHSTGPLHHHNMAPHLHHHNTDLHLHHSTRLHTLHNTPHNHHQYTPPQPQDPTVYPRALHPLHQVTALHSQHVTIHHQTGHRLTHRLTHQLTHHLIHQLPHPIHPLIPPLLLHHHQLLLHHHQLPPSPQPLPPHL